MFKLKNKSVVLFLISLSFASFLHAAEKHEHGVAHLDISFEGDRGEIALEMSGDIVLGHERAPKNESERKTETERLAKFENLIKNKIQFLGGTCQWGKTSTRVQRHRHKKSEHADIEFNGKIECPGGITGNTLSVKIHEDYPGLRRVEAQIITPDLQKGQVFDPSVSTLKLVP